MTPTVRYDNPKNDFKIQDRLQYLNNPWITDRNVTLSRRTYYVVLGDSLSQTDVCSLTRSQNIWKAS